MPGVSPPVLLVRILVRTIARFVQGLARLRDKLEEKVGLGKETISVTLPQSQKRVNLKLSGEVFRSVFLYGSVGYEPQSATLWQSLCKQADVVLDIGSHVGYFSLLAADANPSIIVHSFEPEPDNFAMLQMNIQQMQCGSRVRAHQLAISNSDGHSLLRLRGSSGSTLAADFWEDTGSLSTLEVETTTLDSWLSRNGVELTCNSLVKMDVETHEPAVLEGAANTLGRGPAIVCEVLASFTEERLNELLPASRWRYFWLGPDGPNERRRIVGDPSWIHNNYLFLAKDSPFLPLIVSL